MITPAAALLALLMVSAEPPDPSSSVGSSDMAPSDPGPSDALDAPAPLSVDVAPAAPVIDPSSSDVARGSPLDPARVDRRDEDEQSFGAVFAPVVLPPTSMATYGYVGFSELGAGYRYGLGVVELEGRLKADYRLVSLAAEGVVKIAALQTKGFALAPYLGIGFAGDAGAQYLTPGNFAYVAVRVLGGANASYRLTDTLYLLAAFEMTLDLCVSPTHAYRFAPLIGPGAELFLSRDLSISLMGLVGPDVFQPQARQASVQLGYGVRLGLGFRIF